MAPELHEHYAVAARQVGLSLNLYLNYALARFADLPVPEECANGSGEQWQLRFTDDAEGAA